MGNRPGGSAGPPYSGRVPLGPDPVRARAVAGHLDALATTMGDAEDDVLGCLVVTGEPRPQRVLDDWLDQVVDTLRALGETAADLAPVLARHAVGPADGVGAGASDADVAARAQEVDR